MSTTYLTVKWTVSRGRDTYGYNIVTLTTEDHPKPKRFRAMGGGYDMTGTVFGNWLQETYQDRLLSIADQAHGSYVESDEGPWERLPENRDGLYGMTLYTKTRKVSLDGACGLSSMIRVAEAIGLDVRKTWNQRTGDTTGFIVTDTADADEEN